MTGNLCLLLVATAGFLGACSGTSTSEATNDTDTTATTDLSFKIVRISEEGNLWFAYTMADVNGDGLQDFITNNNGGFGGWMGWLEARKDSLWPIHIVAEQGPTDSTFSASALDAKDIDGDGDIDLLGLQQTGAWDNEDQPTEMFWYENPAWNYHRIGTAPDFIKDIKIVDLNDDGKNDIVAMTYVESNFFVLRQDGPEQWTKVNDQQITNLHEGMDVGDIDGDGDLDVAANGYWIQNPGGNLEAPWKTYVIDEQWHNQDGDWSKNATKTTCYDFDQDGRVEILTSHSERAGYPIVLYHSDDPVRGTWQQEVLMENVAACHTLQVSDIDLDGDTDIVTGVNRARAEDLGVDRAEIFILVNDGQNNFSPTVISEEGIYNGFVTDFEGDGDDDIIRLSGHDAKNIELMLNTLRP